MQTPQSYCSYTRRLIWTRASSDKTDVAQVGPNISMAITTGAPTGPTNPIVRWCDGIARYRRASQWRWCTTLGFDEAAVGSLAALTAAGARSRHEIENPSEVQDEVSRGELVSVRAGLGPARGRDAVALCRRHGRVAPVAVRSTRRAEEVLGLCDRDGVDAPPRLPVALAPSGRLLAVGLVVDGCRSRSPRPHHALPTESVSRG